MSSKVNLSVGRRSIYSGQNSSTSDRLLTSLSKPLSLTMGPDVIFANAIGDAEAMAIVEGWRPRFIIRYATLKEERAWL